MSIIFLNVPFSDKDEAKSLGCKWNTEKGLWFCYEKNDKKDIILKKFKAFEELKELKGENRTFLGNKLFIDLIPKTSWFQNVRSCLNDKTDWLKIQKLVFERVNYKCECCGVSCKIRELYEDDDYEDYDANFDGDRSFGSYDDDIKDIIHRYYEGDFISDKEYDKYKDLFLYKKELNKWNTKQLECHERWSYDNKNEIQKLERLIALCHRCHSATHTGYSGLRGITHLVNKHLMKVKEINENELTEHGKEQTTLWRERNKIKWKLNMDIISESGIELNL